MTSLATAGLSNAEGVNVGTVTLNENGESLSLDLALEGLDAGEHAFHLHTTGKCDAPDFKSAGGHLNPFDKSHGRNSENGKHLGDFPNITMPADGSLEESFPIEGDIAKIKAASFDADGTAAMRHAGPDDYQTDPAGDAGARIACGVLTATR